MLHLHTALNYFQLNHTTPPNAENPQYKELKFKQNFINSNFAEHKISSTTRQQPHVGSAL